MEEKIQNTKYTIIVLLNNLLNIRSIDINLMSKTLIYFVFLIMRNGSLFYYKGTKFILN